MIAEETLRIGVYICHCGSNIAGVVDVEDLARFAQGLPHVALSRHYKYMCSDPGQELVKRDIVELNLNRIVVAACSPNLHAATFRRAAEERRPEPLPGADGQHPRAGCLGHGRQGRGHREGQGPSGRGDPPRRRAGALAAAVRRDRAPGPGRRRRHRGNRGGIDAGRRRQGSGPRRARPVDRRAHGHVRQDLPHDGLRRLHPHAEDDRRQTAPEDQDADLLLGGVGRRVRGQLPREDPPQAALHRREPLRRLHDVHRRLHVHPGQVPQPLRPGPGPAQTGLDSLSPGRAADPGGRSRGLFPVGPRQVQAGLRRGLRRAERLPLRSAGQDRGIRRGSDRHRHGLQSLRSRRSFLTTDTASTPTSTPAWKSSGC